VEWWDKAKGRDLEAYLHGLKPDLVINNRVGKRGMDDGDYETPEQEIPHAALGKRLWETCMTLNDTWGYKRDDHNWKQPQDVLRKLADIAGKGGNFLLNVGPTDEGQIPAESVRILEEAGTWLKPNGEAIYGTTYALEKSPAWGSVTRKGNRLYLIVFDWPKEGQPLMLPIRNGVRKAGLLRGKGKVRVENRGEAGLALYLPERPEERYASVVTLQYEGELAPLKSLSERTAAGEPIAAAADGAITLPATGAWVHGKTLKVEQRGGREVLGYWTDRNDYPQWFAQAARPGKHEIALTYACDTGYGGDYTLAIGDQKLTGKSEPTGGWQAFRTVKLGTVDLPAGKVGVTLKPSGAFSQALMNLELVRLTPVR